MALRSGRVGVNPDDVDPITGKVKSSTPADVYTKTQADNKFETKTHASSTYAKKTDVEPVIYTYSGDYTKTWADFLSGLLSEISDIDDVLAAIDAGKHVFLEFISKNDDVAGSRFVMQLVLASATLLMFTRFTSNANVTFSQVEWEKVNWIISGSGNTYVKSGKITTTGAASETDVTNGFPFYSGTAPSSKSGDLMLIIK